MKIVFSEKLLNDKVYIEEVLKNASQFSYLLKELIILEVCLSGEEHTSEEIKDAFYAVAMASEAIPENLKEEYSSGKVKISQMLTNIVSSNATNTNGLKVRPELRWKQGKKNRPGNVSYKMDISFKKDLKKDPSIINKLSNQQVYPIFYNLESLFRNYKLPSRTYATEFKNTCGIHGTRVQTYPIYRTKPKTTLEGLTFDYFCSECLITNIDKEVSNVTN